MRLLHILIRAGAGALLALAPACAAPSPPPGPAPSPAAPPSWSSPQPAATPAAGPEIVFLGDSITAGLGLDPAQNFPALIGARLRAEGYNYSIVNAGVSGDTSAGGLRRLDWALSGRPTVLVVALGGNDALRGLPPADLKKNLARIIAQAQQKQIAVVLAGMEAPPNNGPDYTAQFRAVYLDLTREFKVPYIPFILAGVAGDPALNQPDGIHPNGRGAEIVADTVWSVLMPLLTRSTPTP